MEKTVVGWLIERLMNNQVDNKMLEQALEMEKQQREKDFLAGNNCACMEHENIEDYFNKYIKSE